MTAAGENLALQAARFQPTAADLQRWGRIALHTRQGWINRLFEQIEHEYASFAEQRQHRNLPTGWLLRYRHRFREAVASPPTFAIRLYLCRCPAHMLPIAIWLLGRCANRFKHYDLFNFAIGAPVATKRHAARALRRIEAWPELRQLAAATPQDRRIAWYATEKNVAHRSFSERLTNFAAHVDHSHAVEAVGPSRMLLWFADLDWIRHPPKTAEYFRQILMRIHHWMRRED